MNTAVRYLNAHHGRLELARHGVAPDPAWVAITPRFRASSHVIFLVMAERTARPALAVKLARLQGDATSLDREVAHLRAIQAARPGGYDSIPRVVAYEEHHGHPLLVETALVGEPMDAALVRREQARCCEAVIAWLADLRAAGPAGADAAWHARLVEQPLARLEAALGPGGADGRLLAQTRALGEALQAAGAPLGFEHGDLSHPNVMLLPGGGAGVLDWETAEPAGLPACDLFFFLTYIAFARRGRFSRQGHVAAFHEAFFGPRPWARPYVLSYARQTGLPAAALSPLLALTWARYLAGLLARLGEGGAPAASAQRTADWLRGNRFFALWRHTVDQVGSLDWEA